MKKKKKDKIKKQVILGGAEENQGGLFLASLGISLIILLCCTGMILHSFLSSNPDITTKDITTRAMSTFTVVFIVCWMILSCIFWWILGWIF